MSTRALCTWQTLEKEKTVVTFTCILQLFKVKDDPEFFYKLTHIKSDRFEYILVLFWINSRQLCSHPLESHKSLPWFIE